MKLTIYTGRVEDVLPTLEAGAFDAALCDPPYGLGFLGKSWDTFKPGDSPMRRRAETDAVNAGAARQGGRQRACADFQRRQAREMHSFQAWCETWAALVLERLRPGAHLFAFGGTRTYHRLACAIEDAGFEIRDSFAWIHGCLSEDTEILVDGGWVHYRQATAGRLALCYDAERDEYAWLPIEREFVYDHDEVAYRVVSDLTDQVVTRGHRVIVREGSRWTFRGAEEVAREPEAVVPVLEDVHRLFRELPVCEPYASGSQQVLRRVQDGSDESPEASSADGEAPRDGVGELRRLCGGPMAPRMSRSESEAAGVLEVVRRETSRGASREAFESGTRQLEGRERGIVPQEDDGTEEPGVEGRRHVQAIEGELYRPEVRSVPAGVRVDGTLGRLRHGASACCGEGDRETAVADGGGSSRRSRHEEQRSEEPDAVRHEPRPQAVRGERFTTASVARLIPFRLKGKVWCVKVPTGAFVARRNGKVFVTGNSGFPKSRDIGRDVDALDAVGPRRDRALRFTAWMRSTGISSATINEATGSNMASHYLTDKEQPEIPTAAMFDALRPHLPPVPDEIEALVRSRQVESENVKRRPVVAEVTGADLLNSRPVAIAAQGLERAGRRVYAKTAPHSIDAKRWHGYGTALKPAHEPVTVAMKPLDGTFAANALRHGVSGLNIDDSRIAVAGGSPAAARRDAAQDAPRNREDGPIQNRTSEERYREARLGEEIGRWPANVLLGHAAACELEGACGPECPVAVLDSQSGIVEEKEPSVVRKGETGSDRLGNTSPAFGAENRPSGTVTGVNRGDAGGASRFFYCAKPDSDERNGSRHPTLKPCDLTGYLARMMLPPPRRPGEPPRRILVPFAGAGSEVIGCLRAGWDEVVAVEMSPEFCADIRRRVYREFGLLVTIETGASVDAVAER